MLASVAFNLRYPKRFGFTRRDGKLLEQTVRITTRRGDAPKIGKVEDPDGLLHIEVLEPRLELEYRVTAPWRRSGSSPDHSGAV